MSSMESFGLTIQKFIQENNLEWTDELKEAWNSIQWYPSMLESILDQTIKDQKDAERYMHLKWVITEQAIGFLQVIDKTDAAIDQLMDERIRSYDD